MNTSTEQMTPEKADWLARCFVNGMRKHGVTGKMEPASGEFSARFLSHPWARESVAEGWGRELRMHLIRIVRARIMRGESHDVIEDLMPPKKWIEVEKAAAERTSKAAEWQKANIPSGTNFAAYVEALRRREQAA